MNSFKEKLGKFSVGVSDKSHDGVQGISGEWKSEVGRLGSGNSGSVTN